MSLRRHDLSDGFALVGPRSLLKVIDNFSITSLQIRNIDGTYYLDLSDTGLQLVVGLNTIELTEDEATITVGVNVITVGPEEITIQSGDNVINVGAASCKITVGGSEIEITTDGVVITATEVTIDSPLVSIAGEDFLSHTHSGVTGGTGVTGPVAV